MPLHACIDSKDLIKGNIRYYCQLTRKAISNIILDDAWKADYLFWKMVAISTDSFEEINCHCSIIKITIKQ